MPLTITPDDVRNRGRWTADELSDTVLNSKAFIPAATAWVNEKLNSIGKKYDDLSQDQQTLADAAAIDFCAQTVMVEAARGTLKVGYMTVQQNSPEQMTRIAGNLYESARKFLAMLGVHDEGFYVTGAGKEDYEVD